MRVHAYCIAEDEFSVEFVPGCVPSNTNCKWVCKKLRIQVPGLMTLFLCVVPALCMEILKFQNGLDEDDCASLDGSRQSSMCSQDADVCK